MTVLIKWLKICLILFGTNIYCFAGKEKVICLDSSLFQTPLFIKNTQYIFGIDLNLIRENSKITEEVALKDSLLLNSIDSIDVRDITLYYPKTKEILISTIFERWILTSLLKKKCIIYSFKAEEYIMRLLLSTEKIEKLSFNVYKTTENNQLVFKGLKKTSYSRDEIW